MFEFDATHLLGRHARLHRAKHDQSESLVGGRNVQGVNREGGQVRKVGRRIHLFGQCTPLSREMAIRFCILRARAFVGQTIGVSCELTIEDGPHMRGELCNIIRDPSHPSHSMDCSGNVRPARKVPARCAEWHGLGRNRSYHSAQKEKPPEGGPNWGLLKMSTHRSVRPSSITSVHQ